MSRGANGPQAHATGRDLDCLVGYQLRRVGALVVKDLGQIFGLIGLAPGQFSILMLIADHPECSQTDLAQIARLDPSTLVPVIERLLKLGLIKRVQNDRDRRAYRLTVSARGRHAIERVAPLVEVYEQELTSNLSERQKNQLLAALQRVETALAATADHAISRS